MFLILLTISAWNFEKMAIELVLKLPQKEALAWHKAWPNCPKNGAVKSPYYLPSPGGVAPGMDHLDPAFWFQVHVSKAAGERPEEQQEITRGK